MISPLSAPAAPSSDRPAYHVRLDKQLLDLLRDAMQQAGYDPDSLTVNSPDTRQNPAASRQNSVTHADPPAQPGVGFVPHFRAASLEDSFGHKWSINQNYFADRATAEWIARKYGTGEVIEHDFVGSGGPFLADQREYHIRLADGRTVNAGILASYYDRNPESRFPGVADSMIRRQLEMEAGYAA